MRITDRKKELIITAGGKNISPANLEAKLKTVPLIGQAAAIGDNRPFVSALVVIDAEVAPGWAARHGIEFTTLEEFAELPEVVEAIHDGVDEAMSEFNNAERVKKVRILTEEWLPDSDLLTPTMKLKRRGIHARYEAEIVRCTPRSRLSVSGATRFPPSSRGGMARRRRAQQAGLEASLPRPPRWAMPEPWPALHRDALGPLLWVFLGGVRGRSLRVVLRRGFIDARWASRLPHTGTLVGST